MKLELSIILDNGAKIDLDKDNFQEVRRFNSDKHNTPLEPSKEYLEDCLQFQFQAKEDKPSPNFRKFKTITPFQISKDCPEIKNGKSKTVTIFGNIRIKREGYESAIYTTVDEIERLRKLSESELKMVLGDYKLATSENSKIVLNNYLKDIKSNEDIPGETIPIISEEKAIPTMSVKTKQLNDLAKALSKK